jgi:urease accessory protein
MTTFAGHLQIRAATRAHGRTVLTAQSFRAPFHLSKPYWDADSKVLLVQVVNPTAGILAGDRLESEITVDANASVLVTTPSVSRVFQMRGRNAECHQRFHVAAGAWLDVMPEPLVPHRGARYRQVTSVDVERGGALFFVDQLVPGRIAHGEAWLWDQLCLDLTVRFGGELILRERLDQSGRELFALAELAGTGPNPCFANAILIGTNSTAEAPWRVAVAALHGDGLWLGASALRRGGWSFKLVGRDNMRLRQGLRDLRRILADYFPRLGCDPRKL